MKNIKSLQTRFTPTLENKTTLAEFPFCTLPNNRLRIHKFSAVSVIRSHNIIVYLIWSCRYYAVDSLTVRFSLTEVDIPFLFADTPYSFVHLRAFSIVKPRDCVNIAVSFWLIFLSSFQVSESDIPDQVLTDALDTTDFPSAHIGDIKNGVVKTDQIHHISEILHKKLWFLNRWWGIWSVTSHFNKSTIMPVV